MFEYNVSNENSPQAFEHICEKISLAFPKAKRHKLLIDVDGTTIQTFTENGKDIDVFDDYEVGAVFVQSQINLEHIFS